MRLHGGERVAIRALAPGAVLLTVLTPTAASAADLIATFLSITDDPAQVILLALLIGVLSFAVLSAIALMRARNRAEAENVELRGRVADLKAVSDRAEALINHEDLRLVAWARSLTAL